MYPVGLMSVPRKWAVKSSLMVLYGFGATLVVWSFWGYKIVFGTQITDALHFVGVPGSMLSPSGEQGQAVIPAQVVALLFILLYDGLATFAICKAINALVKLRLPDSQLEIGDVAVHGDVAYELLPQAPRDRVEAPHSVGRGVIEHA